MALQNQYVKIDWEAIKEQLNKGLDCAEILLPICDGFNPSKHELNQTKFLRLVQELLDEEAYDPRITFKILLYKNPNDPAAVAAWEKSRAEGLKLAGAHVIGYPAYRNQHMESFKNAEKMFGQQYPKGDTGPGKIMADHINTAAQPFTKRRERKNENENGKQAEHEPKVFTLAEANQHVKEETIDPLTFLKPNTLTVVMHYGDKLRKICPSLEYLIETFSFDPKGGVLNSIGYDIGKNCKTEYSVTREKEMQMRIKNKEIQARIKNNDTDHHQDNENNTDIGSEVDIDAQGEVSPQTPSAGQEEDKDNNPEENKMNARHSQKIPFFFKGEVLVDQSGFPDFMRFLPQELILQCFQVNPAGTGEMLAAYVNSSYVGYLTAKIPETKVDLQKQAVVSSGQEQKSVLPLPERDTRTTAVQTATQIMLKTREQDGLLKAQQMINKEVITQTQADDAENRKGLQHH